MVVHLSPTIQEVDAEVETESQIDLDVSETEAEDICSIMNDITDEENIPTDSETEMWLKTHYEPAEYFKEVMSNTSSCHRVEEVRIGKYFWSYNSCPSREHKM